MRGLAWACAISLFCSIFATWWIVSELGGLTAKIAKPYNDLWYAMAVTAPAALFWFWYFAQPKRD